MTTGVSGVTPGGECAAGWLDRRRHFGDEARIIALGGQPMESNVL